MKKDQKGFTIVEVAVVVPIIMLIVLAIFAIITGLLQSSAAERIGAQNLYDIHDALGTIEQDAALSQSFLTSTDSSMNDPYAPSGGWSYAGTKDTDRVLILRNYATTTNPLSQNRTPVFINQQGCDPGALYYNPALTYDTIYFVSNSTLYRRRLVNPSANTCVQQYQKQSCPNGATCAAADEPIASNVTGFGVDYYATSADTVKADAYGPGGDTAVENANAAVVTIAVTRRAYGQPLTSTLSLQVSKLINEGAN